MQYIDSHTHLDLKVFNGVRENLIQEMFSDYGIAAVVNPAISFESNEGMREKLGKYENVYYATGIHPTRIPILCRHEVKNKILKQLRKYAEEPRNVAIGETGLDYHKPEFLNESIIEEQKWWFEQHLIISNRLELPLILHIRGCDEDKDKRFGVEYKNIEFKKQYLDEDVNESALDILKKNLPKDGKYRGVVHCFDAGPEIAEEYIELGFCLGIGGKITHDNNAELKETVRAIELKSILLETDSPFVFPDGATGRFNTPLNLGIIAKKIAEIKNVSQEEVVKITTKNSKKLFNIEI